MSKNITQTFDIRKSLSQPKVVQVYKNDIKLKYNLLFSRQQGGKEGLYKRSKITKLSEKSLKRLAFVANNTHVDFKIMITLTYPQEFPTNGKEVKRHLNHFLTILRKKRKNLSYLWFLEFQKRGAPHIHLLLSTPYLQKDFIALVWYDIVNSYDNRHLMAGTKVERVRETNGAKHYAVKYAMKCRQKEVPAEYENVGRFWGHSKDVKPRLIKWLRVDGYESVHVILSKWKYIHKVSHDKIMSILYNASYLILENKLLMGLN